MTFEKIDTIVRLTIIGAGACCIFGWPGAAVGAVLGVWLALKEIKGKSDG